MYKNKRVLLIAGGGTLGYYTQRELLRLGCSVDVICPEEKASGDERLKFHRALGTYEFLSELLSRESYDGIVNFIHYKDVGEYKTVHELLISNTSHLIFLSSYRVYADLEHPIREGSPRIYDVTDNKAFFAEEDYANPKSQAENYLKGECAGEAWTVVRPVISFSMSRLDMFTYSGSDVLSNKELMMPETARELRAALDWAGNSGKLIAHLLFKPDAYGECFTVSSAQNLTWGEIADIYTDEVGVKFKWTSEDAFLENNEKIQKCPWIYYYDRCYDRYIDNSKILAVTGLCADDFLSIREGLREELNRLGIDK